MKKIFVITTFISLLIITIVGCSNNDKTLAPTSVSGSVICENNDELLANVKISIGEQVTQSNSEGIWKIKEIMPDEYTIEAKKPGYYGYKEKISIEQETSQYEIILNIIEYELDISIKGEGEIHKEKIVSHQSSYPRDTKLEITADPKYGWYFSKWSKDLTGEAKTKTITMDSDKTIKAYFKEFATQSGEIEVKHNFPYSVVDNFSLESVDNESLEINKELEDEYEYEIGYAKNQLIIGFHPYISDETRKNTIDKLGYKIIDEISVLDIYLAETYEDIQKNKIQALSKPEIKYAELNYNLKPTYINTPNDIHYGLQWHYAQIRLPQAWTKTTGDASIRIAVLDSGIDITHPDLGDNIDYENAYDFVKEKPGINEFDDHGTHVAGTIGANTDNFTGVAGVMWDVDILPVRVLGNEKGGNSWMLTKGLLYAAGLLEEPNNPEPVNIINLSLGSPDKMESVTDSIKLIDENTDIIIVAAAGNDNNSIVYPAAIPETIAVGAVNYNYPNVPLRTYYSNYGYELDVVAPGGDNRVDSDNNGYVDGVWSTQVPKDNYKYSALQGTSMAAPHVSGVIGLMLSAGIEPEDVRKILHNTSMDLGTSGFNKYYGHGLINANWAVNNVQEMKIIVGELNGNSIEAIAQTTISSQGGYYLLDAIPEGEYKVFAWVDIKDNDIIEPGDYFAMSEILIFKGGTDYHNLDGFVSEMKEDYIDSLSINKDFAIQR